MAAPGIFPYKLGLFPCNVSVDDFQWAGLACLPFLSWDFGCLVGWGGLAIRMLRQQVGYFPVVPTRGFPEKQERQNKLLLLICFHWWISCKIGPNGDK